MQHTKFNLAEASTWAIGDDFEDTPIECIEFTAEDASATADAWVWLMGVDLADLQAVAMARDEALKDGALFVALNMPAVEFLTWFRRTDWAMFGRTDDGPARAVDAWAWSVVDRARAVVLHLGPVLARQVAMVAAVRRLPG